VSCDWLLVDGPSFIFRAYYGARRDAGAPGGLQLEAVRVFLDRLGLLIAQGSGCPPDLEARGVLLT
jgi:hypothetical protein